MIKFEREKTHSHSARQLGTDVCIYITSFMVLQSMLLYEAGVGGGTLQQVASIHV